MFAVTTSTKFCRLRCSSKAESQAIAFARKLQTCSNVGLSKLSKSIARSVSFWKMPNASNRSDWPESLGVSCEYKSAKTCEHRPNRHTTRSVTESKMSNCESNKTREQYSLQVIFWVVSSSSIKMRDTDSELEDFILGQFLAELVLNRQAKSRLCSKRASSFLAVRGGLQKLNSPKSGSL